MPFAASPLWLPCTDRFSPIPSPVCSGSVCKLPRWNQHLFLQRRRLRRSARVGEDNIAALCWPERIFVVPFSRMPPDPLPALDLTNLSSWERFDTLCRCIVATVMAARSLRREARFVGVFTKPPWMDAKVALALRQSILGIRQPGAPQHTRLEVKGSEVLQLYPEERWVAAALRKVLDRYQNPTKGPLLTGWHAGPEDSFRDVLEQLLGEPGPPTQVFVLDEDAAEDAEVSLARARDSGQRRLLFILGDHVGLSPSSREELVSRFGAVPVQLGPVPLFTSQCITVLHFLLDRVFVSSTEARGAIAADQSCMEGEEVVQPGQRQVHYRV